tara:strand:+ start:406 stop:1053 length:648 start_codon:yes stop_codon:yes gene_type:complete
MPETLTMNDTPADQPDMNADEQDSLQVAESLEGAEQPLLAGKFKDQSSLEQAYLELQKKLGTSNDEPEVGEEVEQEEQSSNEEDVQDEDSSGEQLSEEQASQLFEMVGGEQAYKSMVDWAGQNFTKEEVEMYDSVMSKGDPSSIFFAVQALNSKYTDAVGNDGQLLTGKRSAAQQDVQFRSQQELVQAMNDPRYDRDPAFRDDVIRKLQNSDIEF